MEEHQSRYPVFQGTVTGIAAVIEENGKVFSIVEYFPSGEEPTEKEERSGLWQYLMSFGKQNEGVPAPTETQKRVRRVVVPMQLEAAVFEGAEVRAHFSQIRTGENGKGERYRTYEIEVIKGRCEAMDPMLPFPVDKYTGFKYIYIFHDDS